MTVLNRTICTYSCGLVA